MGLGVTGETKVQEDDASRASLFAHHDVAALQVAVNDAIFMDDAESFADLQRYVQCLFPWKRPPVPYLAGEGDSFQVFHRQKGGCLVFTGGREEIQLMDAADLRAS